MKQRTEFQPLNLDRVNVKSFDCGLTPINTYLHRYAARNMGLGLSSTFILPYKTRASESHKYEIAAFYTLTHQSLVSDSVPTTKNLPRYPTPVILIAQLGVSLAYQGQGLGKNTLLTALEHSLAISSNPTGIPSFGVVLDAVNDEALSFYRSFDFFLEFEGNPNKLFVPMESIAELFDEN